MCAIEQSPGSQLLHSKHRDNGLRLATVIAVAGYSSAGKTTALESIRSHCGGRLCYVGEFVQNEVVARGLEITPESERLVRAELRELNGNTALAELALQEIKNCHQEKLFLIDAICSVDELNFYKDNFGQDLNVIGVSSDFSIRSSRAIARQKRPMDARQLSKRDRFERDLLQLDIVLKLADSTITNNDEIKLLQDTAQALAVRLLDN